jgi:hypothetical protein
MPFLRGLSPEYYERLNGLTFDQKPANYSSVSLLSKSLEETIFDSCLLQIVAHDCF